MSINAERVRRYLQQFDFATLFREELGWEPHKTDLHLTVEGTVYTLRATAEKRGMVVFHLAAPGEIPPANVRNAIELLVAKNHREHFIIFTDGARTEQKWLWVKRELGRPLARRTHEYNPQRQAGDSLLQKLEAIAFSLDEEEELTLVEVTSRVRATFNVERATKKFYDEFKKERGAFEQFVEGIPDADMSKWYVSVMLNRLMFVYFIQRKGFLDGDPDYLRNRLRIMQERYGNDQFYSFYRHFLLRLFHQGLGKPEHDAELERLIGKVPYLNGGIFQLHEVEQQYPDIQISDDAFTRIFDFFDQYQWHLDDRPLQDDREINPDVLGYIFEKYINQKQMGAYYTKEDITDYISKNTIIPFLFNEAQKDCAIAFEGEHSVWSLAQADPDRYLYAAVRKGTELPLPPEIDAGIEDVGQRGQWNTPTPDGYALPTEIWRETVARRQRFAEVRAKLAAGEVTDINDFITYNLDIQQLAQDVIENSEGADLLSAFWKALTHVSVLDPTCGSGAFLFAALNSLQPLYEAAIERMHAFMGEPEWVKLHPRYAERFGKVLADIDRHPNLTYFVLKSIVVNNLYGVDIMPEAVEIAKLRLFLKLTAQVERVEDIEPLPDIDFNIRAGNTLVGFASKAEVAKALQVTQTGQGRLLFGEDQAALTAIEEKAGDVDRLFTRFRAMQTSGDQREFDAADFVATKQRLQARLGELEEELNRLLARQYGVKPDVKKAYQQWQDSHQPFHWFTEFYGILKRGGFDVIIGNPPYVEYRKVKTTYTVTNYVTEDCSDLYAFVMERSLRLINHCGFTGMIVPVSIVSTDGFDSLRAEFVRKSSNIWASSYAERPSKLFTGVEKRLTIWITNMGYGGKFALSKYRRWQSDERDFLFPSLEYTTPPNLLRLSGTSISKISTPIEPRILERISTNKPLGNYIHRSGNHIVYYTRKLRYFVQFFDFVPQITNDKGQTIPPSELKNLSFFSQAHQEAAIAALNSSLYFWFLTIHSDVRNVNKREIETFPFSLDQISHSLMGELQKLARHLMTDFLENSRFITNNYQKYGSLNIQSFQPRLSKPIIDEIDRLLAQHYGFTAEELDFIINYDIKYRLGDDLFTDDEDGSDT